MFDDQAFVHPLAFGTGDRFRLACQSLGQVLRKGQDNRIGRHNKVVNASAWIQSAIEASRAADGANSYELSTHFVTGHFGDVDRCAGGRDGVESCDTAHNVSARVVAN